MAWAGTESWEIYEDYFIWIATGFDADTEATTAIKLWGKVPFFPSSYSMTVSRTAGATGVVDVDLLGYDMLGGTAIELLTCATSNGGTGVVTIQTDFTAATGTWGVHNLPYLKIIVNTVGTGNTLTVCVTGRR